MKNTKGKQRSTESKPNEEMSHLEFLTDKEFLNGGRIQKEEREPESQYQDD